MPPHVAEAPGHNVPWVGHPATGGDIILSILGQACQGRNGVHVGTHCRRHALEPLVHPRDEVVAELLHRPGVPLVFTGPQGITVPQGTVGRKGLEGESLQLVSS